MVWRRRGRLLCGNWYWYWYSGIILVVGYYDTAAAVSAAAAAATSTTISASAKESSFSSSSLPRLSMQRMQRFDLKPTGALAKERYRRLLMLRRRRRRLEKEKDKAGDSIQEYEEEEDDDADDHDHDHDDDSWFHPQVRAVYATLHPITSSSPNSNSNTDDDDDADDDDHDTGDFHRHYHEFVKHRHLSRYERQLRTELQHDAHPLWKGNYSEFSVPAVMTTTPTPTPIPNTTLSNATLLAPIQNEQRRRRRRRRLFSQQIIRPGAPDGDDRNSVSSSVISGGQFNHYQGIPLSQGYGTHYVHLWVGSPIPQRQSVIVDTGSHFTAFPCTGCRDCGQDHHTDPYFDPTQSQTFHSLTCPKECQEHATCETTTTTTSTTTTNDGVEEQQGPDQRTMNRQQQQQQPPPPPHTIMGNVRYNHPSTQYHSENMDDDDDDNNNNIKKKGDPATASPRCQFTQSYTEGSSWTAYQARDVVYAGGPDVLEAANPLDRQYSLPFMFGCLQQSSGLFITQLADGIMGMSAHEATLPKQLYNHGKLEYNMFAMCFRKELGTSRRGVTAGSMTLGGVSSTLDTSPMVFARNTQPYGWFTVYVENIYIAKNGGSQFLLDDSASQKLLDSISKVPINVEKVNSGKGVIVDSGTTDTYLNINAMPAFIKVWKQVTGGMEYTHAPVFLTKSQLERLPTVLIQCQAAPSSSIINSGGGAATTSKEPTTTSTTDPTTRTRTKATTATTTTTTTTAAPPPLVDAPLVVGQVGRLDPKRPQDFLWAIPAEHYMEYSPTLKMYTSRLYFTETRGGVLGANAMQGHNVLFDWQHGRIGFSQSSCEYDLLEQQDNRDYAKETYPSGNCVLGSPILTTSCIESVDVSICEASDRPDNVQVLGTEVWTRVVETPGSDPESCQQVAANELLSSTSGGGGGGGDRAYLDAEWDESVVECSWKGLCTEFRPCQIPCLEAMEHYKSSQTKKMILTSETASDPKGEKDNVQCGDTFWSACDFDCEQSRLVSVLTEDGVCKESSRASRECHVDACGRTDPCLVPFLVHAILVLETPNQDEWTLSSLERFQEEFTRVAHLPEFSSIAARRPLFRQGDVDVLVVRPWQDEEGGTEGTVFKERQHQGIQLILQVSIFNPNVLKISYRSKDRRLTEDSGNAKRQLLQEVGVLWQNLTQPFRVPKQTFTCNPSDLYPLAKDAVEMANGILEHPQFGTRLLEHMPSYYTKARVVSSWTIGTQVYDANVNYYGPIAMTPYLLIFRILYETSLVFFFLSLCSCILQCCHTYRHFWSALRRRWCGKPARYYQAIETDDPDEERLTEQKSPGSSSSSSNSRGNSPRDVQMELELSYVRTFSDSHNKSATKATKRHNSLSHPRSLESPKVDSF